MTIADELAKEHREISVAEFFERNKHLLGFENLQKSLLTCVREAVDNSLDACEDARTLPDIFVEVRKVGEDRFLLITEDNGPGIVKKNLPRVFGKLLYGGKFNRKQSRGQQGIGISASVLYSQLTTGKPTKVYSRIGDGKVRIYELHIDTMKNEPEIMSETEAFGDGHGIRIEMEIKGRYVKGRSSVEDYLLQTSIMNPYAKIVYIDPEGRQTEFARAIDKLPKEAKDIKPHPHGTELGILIKMLRRTKARNISGFLSSEFSRIGHDMAVSVCNEAGLDHKLNPHNLTREEAERIHNALNSAKLQRPPTDCLSPVGEKAIIAGLTKEMKPEFVVATSRNPTVYSGNPFQVEIGIAYGGDLDKEGAARIMRFSNKVPLVYQQSACAMTKAIAETNWKRYGLQQSAGSLPQGPIAIAMHLASIWVPYTSEGKEAIASYPAIVKEMKLSLQDALRKLYLYLAKKRSANEKAMKRDLLMRYAEEVAEATSSLTEKDKKEDILKELKEIVESRWIEEEEEEKAAAASGDNPVIVSDGGSEEGAIPEDDSEAVSADDSEDSGDAGIADAGTEEEGKSKKKKRSPIAALEGE